ncbi:MAG: hypothetical protein RL291_654, partial [Pseudomonadota bacterium]
MTTLSSQLIIGLQDRFTSRTGAIVGSADRVARAMGRIKAAEGGMVVAMQATGRRVAGVARNINGSVVAPIGLGTAALVAATQDFAKAEVGVQIAGIADNLKDGLVDFAKLRKEAEETKRVALELSAALRLKPDGLLKAGEAAAKMGLPAQNLATLMKMAGSINIQDNSVTPEQAAEFLGSMGINFKAGDAAFERGTGKGDYDADAVKIANQMLAIANMTRTSAGKLQEGIRQFGPLYASFGKTFAESASMNGAMVQAGQLDTESGTALKSAGTRMLNPSAQGRDAMLKAGIDRSLYMDLTAVSGGKAFTDLMRLTDVRLSTAQRDALKAKLIDGEKRGKFLDADWQQEFARLYNSATSAKTAEARDQNMERLLMALTTGGGKIDMFKLYKDLSDKMSAGTLTDAQLARIFEGRHISKYKALFALMPKMLDLAKRTKDLKSEYTDAGTKLWRDSSAGRWEGAVAGLSRALIRLRESEGITRLIDSLTRLGEAAAKAPPWMIEALGKALVGLALVAPASTAMTGIAAAFLLLSRVGPAIVALTAAMNWLVGSLGILAIVTRTGGIAMGVALIGQAMWGAVAAIGVGVTTAATGIAGL